MSEQDKKPKTIDWGEISDEDDDVSEESPGRVPSRGEINRDEEAPEAPETEEGQGKKDNNEYSPKKPYHQHKTWEELKKYMIEEINKLQGPKVIINVYDLEHDTVGEDIAEFYHPLAIEDIAGNPKREGYFDLVFSNKEDAIKVVERGTGVIGKKNFKMRMSLRNYPKPYRSNKKPYGDKPYGDKPYGDKPYGDKPYRQKYRDDKYANGGGDKYGGGRNDKYDQSRPYNDNRKRDNWNQEGPRDNWNQDRKERKDYGDRDQQYNNNRKRDNWNQEGPRDNWNQDRKERKDYGDRDQPYEVRKRNQQQQQNQRQEDVKTEQEGPKIKFTNAKRDEQKKVEDQQKQEEEQRKLEEQQREKQKQEEQEQQQKQQQQQREQREQKEQKEQKEGGQRRSDNEKWEKGQQVDVERDSSRRGGDQRRDNYYKGDYQKRDNYKNDYQPRQKKYDDYGYNDEYDSGKRYYKNRNPEENQDTIQKGRGMKKYGKDESLEQDKLLVMEKQTSYKSQGSDRDVEYGKGGYSKNYGGGYQGDKYHGDDRYNKKSYYGDRDNKGNNKEAGGAGYGGNREEVIYTVKRPSNKEEEEAKTKTEANKGKESQNTAATTTATTSTTQGNKNPKQAVVKKGSFNQGSKNTANPFGLLSN